MSKQSPTNAMQCQTRVEPKSIQSPTNVQPISHQCATYVQPKSNESPTNVKPKSLLSFLILNRCPLTYSPTLWTRRRRKDREGDQKRDQTERQGGKIKPKHHREETDREGKWGEIDFLFWENQSSTLCPSNLFGMLTNDMDLKNDDLAHHIFLPNSY